MGFTGQHNRNNRPKRLLIAVFLLVLIVFPNPQLQASHPEDIIVVANNAVKQRSITLAELREYFLRKRHTWGPGQKAVPIHAKQSGRLREVFNRKVLNMTIQDELQYWQIRKIKFGDSSIPEFGNNLKAVFKIKGSVSYVFRSQFKEGVAKVLLVIPAD